MRLVIAHDNKEMNVWAANYIAKCINEYKDTAYPFVLGLSTGRSLIGIYENLAQLAKEGKVSFANVVTFTMEEFVGIPESHPHSSHTFMFRHFFSLISIAPENVHFLDGNAEDLDAECDRYENDIKAFGGIDLFVTCIGEDGHVGFNEPGSSLYSITRPKTLSYETKLAFADVFDNNVNNVPSVALTCGINTLMQAHELMVAVGGAKHAMALSNIVEGSVSHICPVSAFQLHPKSVVVCDKDATLELKVRTVRYFKGLMKEYKKNHPDDALGLMKLPEREDDVEFSKKKLLASGKSSKRMPPPFAAK